MCVCVCCGPISMANVFSSNFFFHLSTLLKAYTTFPPHLFVGKEREQKLFHFLFVFAFFLVHFICRYRMYCIERLAYLSCKRGKVEYDYNMSKSFKPKSTLLLSQQRCNIKQKSNKKVSKTYSLLTINFDVLYTIHSTTTKAFELMLQCLLICLLQEIVIILTNHFKLSFLLLH